MAFHRNTLLLLLGAMVVQASDVPSSEQELAERGLGDVFLRTKPVPVASVGIQVTVKGSGKSQTLPVLLDTGSTHLLYNDNCVGCWRQLTQQDHHVKGYIHGNGIRPDDLRFGSGDFEVVARGQWEEGTVSVGKFKAKQVRLCECHDCLFCLSANTDLTQWL
jgi:hypothetical protein